MFHIRHRNKIQTAALQKIFEQDSDVVDSEMSEIHAVLKERKRSHIIVCEDIDFQNGRKTSIMEPGPRNKYFLAKKVYRYTKSIYRWTDIILKTQKK